MHSACSISACVRSAARPVPDLSLPSPRVMDPSALPATRISIADPVAPLYAYLRAHQPPEHPALRALREATKRLPEHFMQIAPEQGHLMALLLGLLGTRRVLELGTFTGYSALAMALALPSDGRVVTCDVNEAWLELDRHHWVLAGVADRIEARLGPSARTLSSLESQGAAGTFDAALVDADEEGCDAYYEAALRLVRVGGLVMLDSTLRLDRVIEPSAVDDGTVAICTLNAVLAADERVDRAMRPIGDGVTLARRRP